MLRDSRVRRIWSLQTRLKGDCASPVGRALEPEPEPAPFVKLACHSSPWTMETRDHDEPFPDSRPVISAGTARFDTGPPDEAYGRVHARIVGAWAVVIVCAWEGDDLVGGSLLGNHRRRFACRMDRIRSRLPRLDGGRRSCDGLDSLLELVGSGASQRRVCCSLYIVSSHIDEACAGEKRMIRTDVSVPYQDVRARLIADVVNFEPLGRRAVELVAHPHKSKSDRCYVATSCGSEKKTSQTKGATWGRHEKHTFSPPGFPL